MELCPSPAPLDEATAKPACLRRLISVFSQKGDGSSQGQGLAMAGLEGGVARR